MVEKDHAYFIEDFFPPSIIAGFTKVGLDGFDLKNDLRKAINSVDNDIKIAYLDQPHTSITNFIYEDGLYNGDALFTKMDSLILVVKTADCLPLFLWDEANSVIGMVHLGWKSAKEGILDNLPVNFKCLHVVAGVGLRSCCFEVGDELLKYQRLVPFVRSNLLHFDPVAFSKTTLIEQGLRKENFRDSNICSLCSKYNFFSYRRDKVKKRTLSFMVKSN